METTKLANLNEHRPYKDVEIQKLDCVNHVHKRMGAGLRSLLKTSKEIKGGKGGLTSKQINNMSSFYKKAIMDHSTKRKSPSEIEKQVQKMQQRIQANLHHSVFHPDPNVQHQFCDSTWSPYKKDLAEGTSAYSHDDDKKKASTIFFASFIAII